MQAFWKHIIPSRRRNVTNSDLEISEGRTNAATHCANSLISEVVKLSWRDLNESAVAQLLRTILLDNRKSSWAVSYPKGH